MLGRKRPKSHRNWSISGNLYRLDIFPASKAAEQALLAADLHTWHRRLAHSNSATGLAISGSQRNHNSVGKGDQTQTIYKSATTLISLLVITMFRYGLGFRYYSETLKQNSTVSGRRNSVENKQPLCWHMTCINSTAGSSSTHSCIRSTVMQSYITAVPRCNGRVSIPTAVSRS